MAEMQQRLAGSKAKRAFKAWQQQQKHQQQQHPISSPEKPQSNVSLDDELAALSLTEDLSTGRQLSSSLAAAGDLGTEPRLWRPKFTLRNHLDCVRALAFHPNELRIISASEDATIKYWNLEQVSRLKK